MPNTLYGEKAMFWVVQKHPHPVVERVFVVSELDRFDVLVRTEKGCLAVAPTYRLFEKPVKEVFVAF